MTAADVGLVIEVAESSLSDDRGEMLLIYARSGIPVYWIVNLRDRQLEVYTGPSGPSPPIGYRHCNVLYAGADVSVMIDGQEVGRIAVADLLPSQP